MVAHNNNKVIKNDLRNLPKSSISIKKGDKITNKNNNKKLLSQIT